jgi:hypothetical protein
MRGEIVASRFACLFLRSVTSGDTATLEEVEIVYSQQCVDRSGVLNVDKKPMLQICVFVSLLRKLDPLLSFMQIFFLLMYLTTVGTSSTNDIRDAWHAGWWPIKSLLWVALMVVPFLIPSSFIQYYGEYTSTCSGYGTFISLIN